MSKRHLSQRSSKTSALLKGEAPCTPLTDSSCLLSSSYGFTVTALHNCVQANLIPQATLQALVTFVGSSE